MVAVAANGGMDYANTQHRIRSLFRRRATTVVCIELEAEIAAAGDGIAELNTPVSEQPGQSQRANRFEQ
jgi:hypothetical protein